MAIKRRQNKSFDLSVLNARSKNQGQRNISTKKIFFGCVFAFFIFLFSCISFLGNNYLRILFLPGNISKSKIVAKIPFSYVSTIRTKQLQEQTLKRSISVYAIDERRYDKFIRALKLLEEQMENFTYEHTLTEAGRDEIREFVKEFVNSNIIQLEWQDVALLISSLSPLERAQVFQECVLILREIAKDGVYSEDTYGKEEYLRNSNYLGLIIQGGKGRNLRSLESALRYARMHLVSIDIDPDIVSVLFSIIKQGITNNIEQDEEASRTKSAMMLKAIHPVIVKIKKGDVIIDRNAKIDSETYEAINEYRKAIKSFNEIGFGFNRTFYKNTIYGALGILVVLFVLKLFPKKNIFNFKTLFALGVLIATELLLLRLFVQISEYDFIERHFQILCSLYLMPPTLFATGIATLLFGPLSGGIVACLTSTYYTLMVAKPTEFLILLLLSNFIFIKLLQGVNFRIKVFRAGCITGCGMAAFYTLSIIFPFNTTTTQFCVKLASLFGMCLSSGIVVVMLFPLFEKIFSSYSNVSLLEYTDYNHPLLKNLQLAAPGTYNHCLMVSNISEQVAALVGANAVLCKTGALYHDIGKMFKPEYFIENQTNQMNPHDQQTPYISTLVIKNHVKDGVEIAKEYKLPPVIIDAIQQHHGTTLIHYFYEKAKKEYISTLNTDVLSPEEIDSMVLAQVNPSNFRYDGPRPRSKENLIIMLADSIEAASRSMKRVTHQGIENLINAIFAIKLNDHQLDECPITFDEIRDLKKVFASVMLAMMHSRISYSNISNTSNGHDKGNA